MDVEINPTLKKYTLNDFDPIYTSLLDQSCT